MQPVAGAQGLGGGALQRYALYAGAVVCVALLAQLEGIQNLVWNSVGMLTGGSHTRTRARVQLTYSTDSIAVHTTLISEPQHEIGYPQY